MKSLNPYITFNGNCREAMEFYQKCLGGNLSFQTIGDSSLAKSLPLKMKNAIVHAELSSENFSLMATDIVNERGLMKGNRISIVLHCTTGKEARNCYGKLSAGGTQTHQLTITHWGALFGTLTDKYGIEWLINYFDKSIDEELTLSNNKKSSHQQ